MTPHSVGAISGIFVMPPVPAPPSPPSTTVGDDAEAIASGGPSQEDARQRPFTAAGRANPAAPGGPDLIAGGGDAVPDDGAVFPLRRGLEAYGGADGAAAVRAAETVARTMTTQAVAQVARQYGEQDRPRPEPTDGADGIDVVM